MKNHMKNQVGKAATALSLAGMACLAGIACLAALATPALAAPWGNEPHHIEMQRHHDTIAPFINDRSRPALRECAQAASYRLNKNDRAAAATPKDPAAWAERARIMQSYEGCVARANRTPEQKAEVNALRAAVSAQWAELRKNLNSPNAAAKECAVNTARELKATDKEAYLIPKRVAIWQERDRIMHRYGICIQGASKVWGNADHQQQMFRDHREVAPYMNAASPTMKRCAREASNDLNNNDPHANRGYWNVAAWDYRKAVMNRFRTCIRDAKAAGEARSCREVRTCRWVSQYRKQCTSQTICE